MRFGLSDPNDPDDTASRWVLAAIMALAIVMRLAVMLPSWGRIDDPDSYLPLARSLVEGHGFSHKGRPTAYRPPLYPIVLAPLVGTLGDRIFVGVAALHLVLGAGTVV